MKINFRNIRSEESIMGLVMLLTMIVMFITGLLNTAVAAPYMVPVVIAGSAVVLVVILAIMIYEAVIVKAKAEPQDERSAACSLKSTRNAFVVAMVLLAAGMILGWLGAPLERIQALQIIGAFALMTYVGSYIYYKRVN